MLHTLLLLASASLPMQSNDEPDKIQLKDGKAVACRVLYADAEKVVYRASKKNKEVPRADVQSFDSVEGRLREFLEQFDAADPHDASQQATLALWAEEHNLPHEARCTWIRTLLADPNSEQAWTKLGGVKQGDVWKLKVKGKSYTLDELRKRKSEWKTALELPTAHFLIRSDGDPERVLNVAIDVERAYLAFYEMFGPVLKLYVFDEVPELNFVTDPADFPNPPAPGMTVWYERVGNQLYANISENPDRGAIATELCEVLVFNSFRRTLNKHVSEIEPWLRSGLALTFGAGFRPDPGHAKFDLKSPNESLFQSVAKEAKPIELKKLLGTGRGGFDGGPDQMKNYAAAYTLVHFLAFGDGGKYRTAFAEYARDAALGKGGPSNFFGTLKVKEKDLETEWRAYVAKTAGT